MKKLFFICMLGITLPVLSFAQSDARVAAGQADRVEKPIEKYTPEELTGKWVEDLDKMVRLRPEQRERLQSEELLNIARKEIEVNRMEGEDTKKLLQEINDARFALYRRTLNEEQFAKYRKFSEEKKEVIKR